MDDTQRGNRLGPYQLGQRYRDMGSLGRVYRAHNSVTGAPALVLQRTERQGDDAPLADWQVRVTSSVSPSFVALEVERPPTTGNAADMSEELVFMLGDAEEVASATVDRTETMPHLLATPRPPLARRSAALRPIQSWRRPAFAAGLAAAAAAALLHVGGSDAGLETRSEVRPTLAQVVKDAGQDDGGPVGFVLTSTVDDGRILLARDMPRRPFKGQKHPPCDKDLEVEINDGCWVRLKVDGVCPADKAVQYKGECYLPAAKPEAAPTAVSAQPLAFDRP